MDMTGAREPTAREAAELQVEIKRLFTEMEQADLRIKRYQEETDKLKAETRALLVHAGLKGPRVMRRGACPYRSTGTVSPSFG
jgi:hypothetical protein